MPGVPLDNKQAVSYAAFIAAAYSMFEINQANLTPNPVSIPAGWDVVGWINMNDYIVNTERFYGIVAEDSFGNHIIAIRGTETVAEWLEDFDFVAVPFTQVPNAGHVVKGFDDIYSSMKVVERDPDALAAAAAPLSGSFGTQVNTLFARRTQKRAAKGAVTTAAPSQIVAGHSLGAALSTLYVMENGSNGTLKSPLACTEVFSMNETTHRA